MSKGLSEAILSMKMRGIRGFNPEVSQSKKWVNWVTNFGSGTCEYCAEQNGRIYGARTLLYTIPVHPHCNCELRPMMSIKAGTATVDGENGADVWVKKRLGLPRNYIEKKFYGQTANKRDFNNTTTGGNIYHNRDNALPQKRGRVWREADINYRGGARNGHRIVYSNDGLIFATYDHYKTFYEII